MIRAVLLLASLVFAAAAHAEGRIALLIGNGDYAHLSKLANPSHDAEDLGATLKAAGFEVTVATHQDRTSMKAALASFAAAAHKSNVALFHYSGHGFGTGGSSYMLPVDAKVERAEDIAAVAFSLDELLADAVGANHQTLVFIDTNRDNPFKEAALPDPSRRIPAGQVLIAFATAPGDVALDGEGRNSPFTGALIRHLTTKGVVIEQSLKAVRKDVYETTKGQQQPWVNSNLNSEVYLGGP